MPVDYGRRYRIKIQTIKSEDAIIYPKINIIALKNKVTTGIEHILEIYDMKLK